MSHSEIPTVGVGIGLRRENIDELLERRPPDIHCLEIAPENYLHTGGKLYRKFRELSELYPIVAHGLSLSVGSLAPLNRDYLKDLKKFLREHKFSYMTDHLCYASVFGAQFHDLLPMAFTQEAIRHVATRIRQIQDFLEMPFAVENVSYYAAPGEAEMPEWAFVAEIAEAADCSLLLDVNNIYVNSVNHSFDPMEYLKAIPMQRVLHIHLAGHIEYEGFLLDNHGAAIIDPVWKILQETAKNARPAAVIIERDHRMPPFEELLGEVRMARDILAAPLKAELKTVPSRSEHAGRLEGSFGFQL